jgi:2-dehydropantoate 2-reductase
VSGYPVAARGEPATSGDRPARVLVVGPGAVGSFLGGTLAAAGHDVTLLGRHTVSGAHATSLLLAEPDGTRTVPVRRVARAADIDRPVLDVRDLVILAVRQMDIEAALEAAARWPDVPLMTVQNGVGAEELARSARGAAPVLAGSLTAAVEALPGGVRRLRTGGLGVAVVPGGGEPAASAIAGTLVASWTSAGVPARVYPDAAAMKWSKLLANLVGNATSALLDLSPGEVYRDPRTYAIEQDQLGEAVAVMRALGLRPVTLPGADVSLLLRGLSLPPAIGRPFVARAIAGARGGKSPSLRLHLRGGGTGPTEAQWLNGAVAAAGVRAGVPTPVNACLADLMDETSSDPDRAAWFAARPDRLVEAVAAWAAVS